MPYIKQSERQDLAVGYPILTAGQLNYALSRVVLSYLRKHGLRYQTINDIVGALDGCRAEFQRRVVGPYEDKKKAENGDL